ncbi:hypothetical protein AB0M22_25425 [Nocardia sp. NPDC051756]|uniref:hypothetical protein n=1 Tax=Nocardia sp. NPDC051756 TaxID=3154751 RepID=UPI00342F9D0D
MSRVQVTPRRLNTREESIIRKLLSVDFPGVEEFVSQISHTQVVATWGKGSQSLDFRVLPEVPKGPAADGELPVFGEVADANGTITGFITLWVKDGLLNALEYGSHTDDSPASLPDLPAVSVSRFK